MTVVASISFCMLDVSVLGYLKDYGLFCLIDYLGICYNGRARYEYFADGLS
jgi:hypothetical protein